jgi:hypothetical protein
MCFKLIITAYVLKIKKNYLAPYVQVKILPCPTWYK